MTLEAGDIIATGTPPGVGELSVGDEVEIEIEGIGILKNSVVSDRAVGQNSSRFTQLSFY